MKVAESDDRARVGFAWRTKNTILHPALYSSATILMLLRYWFATGLPAPSRIANLSCSMNTRFISTRSFSIALHSAFFAESPQNPDGPLPRAPSLSR